MSMELQVKELVCVLDDIIEVLAADGKTHWKKWMQESKTRIMNSDYSGIEHLLNAFGGMGSFNDLIICQDQIEGRFVWKVGQKNDRLSELRSRAWELARSIQREHDKPVRGS